MRDGLYFLFFRVSCNLEKTQTPKTRNKSDAEGKIYVGFLLAIIRHLRCISDGHMKLASLLKVMPSTSVAFHPSSLPSLHRVPLGW